MRRILVSTLMVAVLAATVACSSSTTDTPDGSATTAPAAASATPAAGAAVPGLAGKKETVTVGNRPSAVYVPSGYRQGTAMPLVVLLHGYTSSGAQQEGYFKITAEAEKRGFLYATPDGTQDTRGNRFWNATDACCNLYGATVDDSTYVSQLITTVGKTYTVDPAKVYLVGHSNGAFMSFRMACDHADQITGIAALNGAMWNDLSKCAPSRPVSVLSIRGTSDGTIAFHGGNIAGNTYPDTETTIGDWVGLDGCGTTPDTSAAPLDLDTAAAGNETTITRYSGCRGNATVELWTMKDGTHIPPFTAAFAPSVMDFLLAKSA